MQYSPESDSEDELPPGWEERATLAGEVYYVNHLSSSTQWTHPRTGSLKSVSDNLPFGWERKILEDNKVLYIDHQNQRTTFTDPRLAFAAEKSPKADGKNAPTFRQKHDASTTALQVLHGMDLTGRVALVTGGSSGIGFQVSRALALHGATVIIAARSESKAERAIAEILKERPTAKLSFIQMDLASLNSVQQACRKLLLQQTRLNYLVLNAGVFGQPFQLTEDALEHMIQVNYLSNFYLVKLLLPRLISSDNCEPAISIVTSESHRFAPVDLDSVDMSRFCPDSWTFVSVDQYNISKLFLIVFAHALHNRYSKEYGIRCTAVHPGNLVSTGLKDAWWFYRLLYTVCRPFTKSADQAAGSIVFSLCSPDVSGIEGFVYINNCFPTKPSHQVEDNRFAEKLWQISEQILKIVKSLFIKKH